MRKGFTLVELLVVIAIIAALAGFAIANLGSAEKATANASVKSDVRNAITQVMVYKANNAGALPITPARVENTGVSAVGADIFANVKTQIGPKTTIKSSLVDCAGGGKGFKVEATAENSSNNYEYDSCANSSVVSADKADIAE